MPRKTIDLTDKAGEIYDSLPWKDKGRFTSDAIIEKHQRDTGTSLEQRMDEIEKRMDEIEARMKGGK